MQVKEYNRRQRLLTAAFVAIAAASLAAYANTFGNAFVAGDVQFIQDNETIKRLSVLRTAFTRGYWWVGGEGGTYYRPLVVLLDAWDHLLWGSDPAGYHGTNTALHVGASWLVFLLARAFLGSPAAGLGAGLLFAVHPIHVHAVSYISARSAVLCAGFYAASALAALRFRDAALAGRASGALWVSLACYAGGLLSLEAAATLPPVLLWLLLERRELRGRWRELLPWLGAMAAITALYFVVRRATLGAALSQREAMIAGLPPLAAVLTMSKVYVFYLVHLVVPAEVSYLPPFRPALSGADPAGLASLAAVAGLAALVVAGPRGWRRERAGLGWVLLTLAPVSGVMPLDHFVKGQYAYLPSIGAVVVLASLARRALRAAGPRRSLRLAVGGASGLLLLAYAARTVASNAHWKTPLTLFTQAIASEAEMPDELLDQPVMRPTAARFASVHLLVAAALVDQQDCPAARPHYLRAMRLTRKRSLRLQARQVEAHCAFKSGDLDAALAAYLPLVDEDPKDPLAPGRVAAIHLRRGSPAEALPFLEKACERGSAGACRERQRLAPQQGAPRDDPP